MRRDSDTFSVEFERLNGPTHLRLAGRFDVAATPVLDSAIAVICRRDVVLDLQAFTFIDSAAWLTIMAYEHRVHEWGMKFRLANVPANIRRIFELTATEYLLPSGQRMNDWRDQEVRNEARSRDRNEWIAGGPARIARQTEHRRVGDGSELTGEGN